MRHYAPYNVDRAPTGQLVAKGSIKDPIQQYPDSKTKIQREQSKKREMGEEQYEQQRRRSSKKRSKSSVRRREELGLSEGEDLRHYGPFNVDRSPTG